MEGFDLVGLSGQAERLGRDLQELGGVAKVEPGFDPVLNTYTIEGVRRDVLDRRHGLQEIIATQLAKSLE
jgi:hypothetical protein